MDRDCDVGETKKVDVLLWASVACVVTTLLLAAFGYRGTM
jgi:hypothetical protein